MVRLSIKRRPGKREPDNGFQWRSDLKEPVSWLLCGAGSAGSGEFLQCRGRKEVVLSYGGQTAEVVFAETTFTNDRQKAKVTVTKQDGDTKNPLDGGIFGLYAGSDITAWDGTVVVKKGTLIEKAVTGEDGTAAFHADLPVGFGYDVKEEQAPEGYLRNTSEVYSFQFAYTNDQEAEVSFTHTFLNERVNAKISLQKKDKENQYEPAAGRCHTGKGRLRTVCPEGYRTSGRGNRRDP